MRPPTPLLCLLLTLAALLTTAPPAHARTDTGPDPARIDAFVTAYLDRHGLPGAAVAVVKDGETVHEAGYGHDSHGRPITEHTRLRIGSLSKPFTAFAVLRLADDGRIDLDAPAADYLPDTAPEGVTVRHLLSHTSGLPNPTIVAPAQTLEEAVAGIQDLPLETRPGTTYRYSNLNYWLAALLVQRVTGHDFTDHLTTDVFTPLGMADTLATTTTNDPVDGLATGHVTAYGHALPAPIPHAMNSGAGAIVSTAHDLAAWLAMQQRGGTTPDGHRLLSADLIEESHTPQPGAQRAGLGWRNSSPHVTPARVSHSGIVTGFNAQHDLVPTSGYGVAVLLNSYTPTRENAYELSSGIIDLTEGRTPDPGTPTATAIDLTLGATTIATAALAALGLRRAPRWAARRTHHPTWRFALRLLPQCIAPAAAAFLFLIAPALQDNSYTPADVFWLFPAFTALLLTLAATGTALTIARTTARIRTRTAPRR
ncbi:serine hydrolase domain-containing protein [Nocardiopsis trehalosi]|uniref:serine hydrolase domain-containing protein n=1 Tax=Nocardiopsis trehalosi TaxID=109329 RepID=UPI000830646D|nr:serine hydrolase domain-containing protein [Nocardiopsis trehalosi]